MKATPGTWAIPLRGRAALVDSIKQARKGGRIVEAVVGCGLFPARSQVPARLIGYVYGVLANLELLRGTFGPKAIIAIRLFCSAPKIAGLGGRIAVEDAVSLGTRTLAVLAAALDLAGMRKFVSSVSVDTASHKIEVPPAVAVPAISLLHNHPDLQPAISAVRQFAEFSDNGADPVIYAVEHAAASMFGDIDTRNILHITIAGGAEKRFFPIRCAVAASAARMQTTTPVMARIMTSIKRTWYSPTENEPTLLELAEDQAGALSKLVTLGRENTSLNFEATSTQRILQTIDHSKLRLLPEIFADQRLALSYFRDGPSGPIHVGPNITSYFHANTK